MGHTVTPPLEYQDATTLTIEEFALVQPGQAATQRRNQKIYFGEA